MGMEIAKAMTMAYGREVIPCGLFACKILGEARIETQSISTGRHIHDPGRRQHLSPGRAGG